MIRFKDSLEFERCIDVSKSFNEKFVNFTIYTPSKNVTGNTLQIPISAFKDLIELMKGVINDKKI